jgi:ubiquinone/menaquinone biosynthesis C-methylase UbiE
MGFYQDRILPHLVHLSMRQRNLVPYRTRVVSHAEGRVLEIGIGSGLNLPYYSARTERVIGLDPSPTLLAMTRKAAQRAVVPVELIENSAEAIALYNRSIDTIVTTWTMCSIPDVQRALGEMRRVLKPGGHLVFVEHGRSPDPGVRRWQDRLTPVWRCFSGGCHLNRPISELIESAGFRIERIETGYMRGPKPMTFMYEGSARPR